MKFSGTVLDANRECENESVAFARSKIAALKARGARLIGPGHAIIVLSALSVCYNNLSTQPRNEGGSTSPLIFPDVRKAAL